MDVAAGEPPLVTLGVSLMWIVGLFCAIATVVLLIVGSRLARGGQAAQRARLVRCSEVQPGDRPVHLAGTSAPGPGGLVAGPVSRTECVWYRARVYRVYEGIRWREGASGWEKVPARREEQIWETESGPFALRDDSGAVLLDTTVVDRRTTHAYPKENAVDDIREEGAEPWRYDHGPVGVLSSAGLLPSGLLAGFTRPDAQTAGYRVTEEIIRLGVSFQLYGVAAQWNGQPIMAPVGDVPAISVEGMGTVLARGGRSATRMALYFGFACVVCFLLSALILMFR
jgi:hypothetical protein